MNQNLKIPRRRALQIGGVVMTGSLVSLNAGAETSSPLTAKQVNDFLRGLCEVTEPSVDRIIIGDPDMEVKAIGTAWMPYWRTLKEAVAKGINLMVVHEPTFYTHRDLDEDENDYFRAPQEGKDAYIAVRDEKAKWIKDQGMTVIRCHDVWDKIQKIGIPFALGNALGFANDDIVKAYTYYNVYRVKPQSAEELAKRIAAKLKSAGQPGVAFYGDPKRKVETLGVGTGCICDPMNYMDLKPDLFLAIDDSVHTWTQTTYAEDTGHPLVVINHGTSEEFGVRTLNQRLKEQYPNVPIRHFEQGCSYRWITG